jgi:hypothetical protein
MRPIHGQYSFSAMNFDVRDITLPGWILTLLCCAIVAGVAVGFGLLVWSRSSHEEIKSGLQFIIFSGGALGVLAGLAVYLAGAAIAKAQDIPLAQPKERPDVGMHEDIWGLVTLFGLLAVVFGGVILYLKLT